MTGMGRRRKDPREQKARGYPNRRKTKTERAIAAMEAKAAEQAKLLAAGNDPADLQALPVFINDKRLAPAIEVWRQYAPRLDRLQLLTSLDRHTFAVFCIYVAEFALANQDILDKGYSLPVPTVAKDAKGRPGIMLRDNPAVDRRDFAAKMMLDLAEKFGFTPLDRAKLIQNNAMRPDELTLFGRVRPAQVAPAPAPAEPAPQRSAAGSGRDFDSTPPGTRPN
jgi:P27 family predicted phage terminase small subunit